MSNTQHTPGPWEAQKTHPAQAIAIFKAEYPPIAIIRYSDNPLITELQAEANARIIAAAPEMLEACNKMLAWFEEHYTNLMPIDTHFNKNKMLNYARSAIAKAEGRG